MSYTKITESDSLYNNLELLSIKDIIKFINVEDQKIHLAVKKALPEIEKLIMNVYEKLKLGGRLFYVGAGTSGRLGILDASECPPTFGVDEFKVIGIIAGGSEAIKKSFDQKINRLLLHTCSLDHKNALNNYIARGMKIFKSEILKI